MVTDIRRLAYKLAKRNNIRHQLNVELGLAGEDWAKGFMRRHPKLSIRSPEAT